MASSSQPEGRQEAYPCCRVIVAVGSASSIFRFNGHVDFAGTPNVSSRVPVRRRGPRPHSCLRGRGGLKDDPAFGVNMPDELRTDVDTRSPSKGSGQYESELGSEVKADVIGHVGHSGTWGHKHT